MLWLRSSAVTIDNRRTITNMWPKCVPYSNVCLWCQIIANVIHQFGKWFSINLLNCLARTMRIVWPTVQRASQRDAIYCQIQVANNDDINRIFDIYSNGLFQYELYGSRFWFHCEFWISFPKLFRNNLPQTWWKIQLNSFSFSHCVCVCHSLSLGRYFYWTLLLHVWWVSGAHLVKSRVIKPIQNWFGLRHWI